MKILRTSFLLFLILLSAAILALQSDWGKNLALRLFTESLQQAGWKIQVDKIEGNLPHTIVLHHLQATSLTLDLQVERLETRLSLAALLKKEILFTDLQAQGISWQRKAKASQKNLLSQVPRRGVAIRVKHFHLLDVKIPSSPHTETQGAIKVDGTGKFFLQFTAKSQEMPGALAKVSLQGNEKGFIRSKGSFIFPKMSPWDQSAVFHFSLSGKKKLSGKIWGNLYLPGMEKEKISLNASLQIDPLWHIAQADATLASPNFRFHLTTKKEEAQFSANVLNTPWQGSFRISPTEKGSWLLSQIKIEGAGAIASGNVELLQSMRLLGQVNVALSDLHKISDFFGKADGVVTFQPEEEKQGINVQGDTENFHWNSFFAQKGHFIASLNHLDLLFENASYEKASFSTIALKAPLGAQEKPFALALTGRWKHPFYINLAGIAALQKSGASGSIETLQGMLDLRALSLAAPCKFAIFPNNIQVHRLDLLLGDSRVFLNLEKADNLLDLHATLEKFPLEILPLAVDLGGRTDASLVLKEAAGEMAGTFQGTVIPTADSPTFIAGKLKGQITNHLIEAQGSFEIAGKETLVLKTSLPIRFSEGQAELLYDQPVEGFLSFHGNIEEGLDFFNLGTHRMTGVGAAEFTLANTLGDPFIEGNFLLENGSYENYLTGTRLINLRMEGKADGKNLILQSATAGKNGETFSATGSVFLNPAKQFPFVFDIEANPLRATQIDLIASDVEGKIRIEGNLKEARATGQIQVIESNFHIPDRVPRFLPRLVVVYKNPTKPIPVPTPPTQRPYPLFLDLRVTAPKSIKIEGRGLQSEWNGDFHVGGMLSDLTAEGHLELVRGEFSFAGRQFKLLDGKLSFLGREHEMPRLDLAGVMEVKGISITARLKGPLNHPQLTLQSSPPLPLSTIMSYLLFGQDLAEINSFQALQLANSIASLAGQGPDVLENTRKALGVDRLSIVSVSSGDQDIEDTIALQVGKYISEGVLVSLTQGAEDSSTNISIEVELSGGWIVQLESDQRQEQGKFTIKWSHNY